MSQVYVGVTALFLAQSQASCIRNLTSPAPGGLLGFPQYLYCYFTTCCS